MKPSRLVLVLCSTVAPGLIGAARVPAHLVTSAVDRRSLRGEARFTRSVWDSVYTDEQAKRGEAIYRQYCIRCHQEKLNGTTDNPPLAGGVFLGNWNNFTVADLHEKIFTMMPSDSLGLLNRQQVTDVITYVFSFNGFPAGKTELQSTAEYLKDIKIEASKPEKPSR